MASKFTSRQYDAVGNIGGEFNLGDTDLFSVKDALALWAAEFIQEAVNTLRRDGHVSSGYLADSIKPKFTDVPGGYRVSIMVADYYDFVNKGVKGVKSSDKAPNSPYSFKSLTVSYGMALSIRKWMIRRNVQNSKQNTLFPHKKVKTFSETSNSASFAMAFNVKKFGLKPRPFFDNAYDKMMPQLGAYMQRALQKDVTEILKQIVVKRGEVIVQ